MNRLSPSALALAALVALAGCAPTAGLEAPRVEAPAHTFTVLQLNDVYEITPVEAGRSGGLARVAGLRGQLLAEGPPAAGLVCRLCEASEKDVRCGGGRREGEATRAEGEGGG